MARVVVTLKIMPEDPSVDLEGVFTKAEELIRGFVDEAHKEGEIRKELKDIGFGVKALNVTFVMDESLGTTDSLEEQIKTLEGVQSVEATDVRRALG